MTFEEPRDNEYEDSCGLCGQVWVAFKAWVVVLVFKKLSRIPRRTLVELPRRIVDFHKTFAYFDRSLIIDSKRGLPLELGCTVTGQVAIIKRSDYFFLFLKES